MIVKGKIVFVQRALYTCLGIAFLSALTDQAEKLEEEGFYRQAAIVWELRLEENPDDDYALYRLGRLYARLDDFTEAQKALQKSLRLNPENFDAKVSYAYVLLSLDQPFEAQMLFQEILEKYPQYSDAQRGLLIANQKIQEKKEEERFQKNLPKMREAVRFEEEKNYREALAIWESLLKEDPDNAFYFFHMAKNHYALEEYKLAKSYIVHARFLDPDNTDYEAFLMQMQEPFATKKGELVEQAEALERRGESAKALIIWQELMELYPHEGYFPYKIGRFYYEQDQLKTAETYFRLTPDNVDAKVLLAYLLMRQEKYEEAKELFQEVLAAVPSYEDASKGLEKIDRILSAPRPRFTEQQQSYIDLAECYEKKKDYDNAAVIWKRAYLESPEDSFVAYRLGQIYLWQRKYSDAETYLYQAMLLDPDLEMARFRLGSVYAARGERRKALNLYHELTEKSPENGDYLEALARSHRSLNDYVSAKDVYIQRFTMGDPHYNLFDQYRNVLERTNFSLVGSMLYAQERETDIPTNTLAAQRNTVVSMVTAHRPISDRFRISGNFIDSTIRELNLVSNTNNLFLKTQDYVMRANWWLLPELSMSGGVDYQVGNDIGEPNFPIGHRERILPNFAVNYASPIHFATLSMKFDTLLIKDFIAVPLKGNLLERQTYFFRDEWRVLYRLVKFGGEGFLRYYDGDPYNRQWQGVLFGEVGFPKYNPLFYIRYWGQVGGFKTNQTVYYSYKRQWQHSAFLIFSKQTALNLQIDFALEQAWQWNRKLNQPVNTVLFVDKLFRSYEKIYFEVKQLYRPKTEFGFRVTSYWDSTRYTTWDVKGSLTHIF